MSDLSLAALLVGPGHRRTYAVDLAITVCNYGDTLSIARLSAAVGASYPGRLPEDLAANSTTHRPPVADCGPASR